mmetsp:Transcript_26020/g.61362  ORF Transcript_26020/g.61362 Transcript_26020/m.61362 type:complete len:240 (-) Transcript_26020:14-733(-)
MSAAGKTPMQCMLLGAVHKDRHAEIISVLRGISGQEPSELNQRELTYIPSSRVASGPGPTQTGANDLRVRSDHTSKGQSLTLIYVGELQQLPATVLQKLPENQEIAPTIRQMVSVEVGCNQHLQHFLSAIGYKLDFQFMRKGDSFILPTTTKSRLQVTVSMICEMDKLNKPSELVDDTYLVELTATSDAATQGPALDTQLTDVVKEMMALAECLAPYVTMNRAEHKTLRVGGERKRTQE